MEQKMHSKRFKDTCGQLSFVVLFPKRFVMIEFGLGINISNQHLINLMVFEGLWVGILSQIINEKLNSWEGVNYTLASSKMSQSI